MMETIKQKILIAKTKIDDDAFITALFFRLPLKYTCMCYTLYNKEFTDKNLNDAKESFIKIISDEIEKAFLSIKK